MRNIFLPVLLLLIASAHADTGVSVASPEKLRQDLLGSGGAARVGVIVSGTGAVARTLASRANDEINAQDFSVKCDSSTDDRAALQAAVTAHKRVNLPVGTCLINGSINLQAGSVLRGKGIGLTVLKQTGTVTTSAGLLYANSGSSGSRLAGIVLEDMTIDGNGAALGGLSQFQHAISLNGIEKSSIRRVEVRAFRGDGIYLGSGITGGDERHNVNVTIDAVTVDGVDNHNRNGISVIDADGLVISNSNFMNCSDPSMPGAIDIEPDASAFHVVRNIIVRHNQFTNITGGNGVVALYLTAVYTTVAENFIITGNEVSSSTYGFTFLNALANNSKPRNIVLSDNSGYDIGAPFRFISPGAGPGYWRGITISGNIFYYDGQPYLGYNNGDTIADTILANNLLIAKAGANGVVVRTANNLLVTGNVFRGQSTYGMLFSGTGNTITSVTMTGNSFQAIGVRAIENGGGTWFPDTNVFLNNSLGSYGHQFNAYKSDNAGTVTNGASATTFNFGTLPDSFPAGVSMAVINGDTTGPAGTGADQGTLYTYRATMTAGYEKFTFQLYYHANNALKLGSFWIRRRNSGANTWSAWVEQAT